MVWKWGVMKEKGNKINFVTGVYIPFASDKLIEIDKIVSDELNLKFDVTGKLKEIKKIIRGEEWKKRS